MGSEKHTADVVLPVKFFKVIADSFLKIPPLTTLFYKQAGTVHHKWADGTWRTLLMEEGVSQGCPLSPICASFVGATLLQPLDIELRERAATRLQNGDPGDDGFGGITHLLGYDDDVSAFIPLADLKFLCDQFATIWAPLGCFVNPMKTRILTSTFRAIPHYQISIKSILHLPPQSPTPSPSTLPNQTISIS